MAAPSPLVIDGVKVAVRPVTLLIFPPNVPEYCGHPGYVTGHGLDLTEGVRCGWCHVDHPVTGLVEIYSTL
jgi:hypothetical protein